MGAGDHGQVLATQVGRDVAFGRAPALAAFLRDLRVGYAVLLGAVVIGCARDANLFAGLHEHFIERAGAAQVADVQRAADTTVFGSTKALVVFCAFEQWQHVLVAPARVALGGPVVVVVAVAAGVDHGIDGAGPTHHLAARLEALAPVEASLRHGLVAPTEQFQWRCGGKSQRRVDEGGRIRAAGFEQTHGDGRVFAQAARHHTAGGTAAHHDVIKFLHAIVSSRCREISGQ